MIMYGENSQASTKHPIRSNINNNYKGKEETLKTFGKYTIDLHSNLKKQSKLHSRALREVNHKKLSTVLFDLRL